MKIVLRPHLKLRLIQRQIPINYPKKILSKPNSKYYDTLSNHLIAIKSLKYSDKVRPMAIAYDIIGNEIQIITVHPISKKEITSKIKVGRWIQNEES